MLPKKPKFPLKMKNGVSVRTLEELKKNGDLESIIHYYFSGQLARWYSATGNGDIQNPIFENNKRFVESVVNILGLENSLSKNEIQEYVIKDFGFNTCSDIMDIDKVCIADNQQIKKKLATMIDEQINLEDYLIESIPLKNDDRIESYRVRISNVNTGLYSIFFLPYDYNIDQEVFENRLYMRIQHEIELDYSLNSIRTQTDNYVKPESGAIIEFGEYDSSKIKWKVIKVEDNIISMISLGVLCTMSYDNKSEEWMRSNIRSWLNNEFYKSSFSLDEQKKIVSVGSDKVTILSKEESENLLSKEEYTDNGLWWWARSTNSSFNGRAWCVYSDGTFGFSDINFAGGVRPVISIRI